MLALGISPNTVSGIVALRQIAPIHDMGQLAAFHEGGAGLGQLGISNGTVATLRATAQLRLANGQLSDVRRTVSAVVKFLEQDSPLLQPGSLPYHILRWYDNAAPLQ